MGTGTEVLLGDNWKSRKLTKAWKNSVTATSTNIMSCPTKLIQFRLSEKLFSFFINRSVAPSIIRCVNNCKKKQINVRQFMHATASK
jgi:hypothetical protein